MYSEQLEALVRSIIADGKITDKERAVLHKKAEAEGVDIDEIDIYVEGLITQMINEGKTTAFVSEHDSILFTKETSDNGYEPIYYRFKNVYLLKNISSGNHCARDIQISFMDVTNANYKKAYNWERHMGIGLLFSVNVNARVRYGYPTLCISSNGNDFLSLAYDSGYNDFQLQRIDDKSADETYAYKIDKEDLQVLCKTEDIQVRFLYQYADQQNVILKETSLPGFQYYAQYFYRVMVDPEAYPDAEKHLKSFKKATREKRVAVQKEIIDRTEQQAIVDKTEQQVAGILSRKVKGKRVTPSPYNMKQYIVLDTVVTDICSRIVTLPKNDYEQYTPHLFLHAITTNDNKYVFYLCITTHGSMNAGKTVVLSINLQDHTLLPVTGKKSFLSDKNPHKETDNKYYNFYYIDKDTMSAFLNAKDASLKFGKGEYVEERKIPSIPKKWKKAFEMLEKKDNLKKWRENAGALSKFCQTYFQISDSLMMVYVALVLIILFLIFF